MGVALLTRSFEVLLRGTFPQSQDLIVVRCDSYPPDLRDDNNFSLLAARC